MTKTISKLILNWQTYRIKEYVESFREEYHIPSAIEWWWLKTIMDWLSLTSWNDWRINLHLPYAGSRRSSDTAIRYQESEGFYWTSTWITDDPTYHANYLYIRSNFVNTNATSYTTAGRSIRCFKNNYEQPTSSWTVINWTLWSAWIFRDQTNWRISITLDWNTGYTIMDKNLWAVSVYSDWDVYTEDNMWAMYQWWNNYWFSSTWAISNTASIQVDTTWYWPYEYSSDIFITWLSDWLSVPNPNLWWWASS